MKKYMNMCRGSDWVGNPQATLVIMVTSVTFVIIIFITMVTMVTMALWGTPANPDNSEVTGAIRNVKDKILTKREDNYTVRTFLNILIIVAKV
jgi:hypothetical protein